LESFKPDEVAQAFYHAMKEFDINANEIITPENIPPPALVDESEQELGILTEEDDEKSSKENQASTKVSTQGLLQEFVHILQFCYLCYKGSAGNLLRRHHPSD
jgi:hypothetical protein